MLTELFAFNPYLFLRGDDALPSHEVIDAINEAMNWSFQDTPAALCFISRQAHTPTLPKSLEAEVLITLMDRW